MIMGVIPNGKRDVAIRVAITGHLWGAARCSRPSLHLTAIWKLHSLNVSNTHQKHKFVLWVVRVLPACRRQNEHNRSKKLDASWLYCLKYSTLKLLVLCLILWRLKISANLLNFSPTRREKVTVSFCREKTSPNFQEKKEEIMHFQWPAAVCASVSTLICVNVDKFITPKAPQRW